MSPQTEDWLAKIIAGAIFAAVLAALGPIMRRTKKPEPFETTDTVLTLAIRDKSLDRVAEILAEQSWLLEESDKLGWYPIHRAAEAKNLPILEKLVAAGATVDRANSNGKTAIEIARAGGWEKGAAFLAGAATQRR